MRYPFCGVVSHLHFAWLQATNRKSHIALWIATPNHSKQANKINKVQAWSIVKTNGLRGVFVKISDFKQKKGSLMEFPRKSETSRKSPERWTFLSLALYNAPNYLHTVDSRSFLSLFFGGKRQGRPPKQASIFYPYRSCRTEMGLLEPFFQEPKVEPEPSEPFVRNRSRKANCAIPLNCTEMHRKPFPQTLSFLSLFFGMTGKEPSEPKTETAWTVPGANRNRTELGPPWRKGKRVPEVGTKPLKALRGYWASNRGSNRGSKV